MANDKKLVAIDTDFFIKTTEKNPDGIIFRSICDELNIQPVMQKYVFEHELIGNSIATKMVKDGTIRIFDYDMYINANIKNKYVSDFEKLYKDFNNCSFEGDVHHYRHQGENLGEIRTILMAFYYNIDIFLSDDYKVKYYIESKLNNKRYQITVHNIYDVFMSIGRKPKRMKWDTIKGFLKRVIKDKEKYNKINDCWHS